MEQVQLFLETYGYGALFVLGFAEFAGVPIATVPVLLATGALASASALRIEGVIVSVALGGLLADSAWMLFARRRGRSIVNVACGLSINPGSCVLKVCEKVTRFGAPYLVLGKFIPGTSGLLATAAALSGISWRRFAAVDALALLLWASTYTAIGWLFAGEFQWMLAWAVSHRNAVLGLLASAAVLAAWARTAKSRAHRRVHGQISPAELP
jgi:membrane protein DedA with SNARE-associated domain